MTTNSPSWVYRTLCLLLVFPSLAVSSTKTNAAASSSATSTTTTLDQDTTTNNRPDLTAATLIDWIQSHGGTFHDAIEVRPSPTRWMAVAQTPIAAKEVLWEIPLQYSLPPLNTTDNEEEVGDEDMSFMCDTTRQLLQELELGSVNSIYGPWIDYWQHTSDLPSVQHIPSMWSEDGKDLFLALVGWSLVYDDEDDEEEAEPMATQILPPLDPTAWIDYDWHFMCDGGDSLLEHGAFLTVTQHRAWRSVVPMMDWLTLGSQPNVVISKSTNKSTIQVRAARDIQPNEPLIRKHGELEGTPDTFRDWGYIEDLPHTFLLPGTDMRFVVDQKEPEEDEQMRLHITSLEGVTVEELNVEFFDSELRRLHGFAQLYILPGKPDNIPEQEWTMLKEYHAAMEQGLQTLGDLKRTSDCESRGDCRVVSFYDPLDEYVDTRIFDVEACDRTLSLDLSRFEAVDVIQSPYQQLEYLKDPANEDVCFRLDGTLQICGNYRPHYHEMVVQYTSRYLKDVRRVLWVGGGDSMLLHEILKYPNLELAIGLELDQQVTRYSFKHFGSQPHWDDERVQWWYGDAAKSLLMLPKEYFGSFDMVLVDLSETVMSMTVTKDLDIMAALSLLIKPDGIFVKNEVYLQKLKDIFEYSVQVEIDDVPMICAQTLVIGSNEIDFLHTDLTDHKVETYLAHLDDINKHEQFIIDAVRNPFAQQYCAMDEEQLEPDFQESSPGLVMVLEAEDAKRPLESAERIKETVFPTLERQGFHILDTFLSNGDVPSVTFVLAEGYVVATAWPGVKYCQFDIHLWSKYRAMDDLKFGLLNAVGSSSKSASAFRIVTTGMFGTETWKADEMARGPVFTQDCSERSTDPHSEKMTDMQVDAVVNGYLNLIPWSNAKAVVFCGPSAEPCNSVSTVESHSDIAQALPVYSCPNMGEDIDYVEDAADIMQSCEDQVWLALREATASSEGVQKSIDDKISVIVLDPSSTRAMARIFHKIASTPAMRDSIFAYDVVALAPILGTEDSWKRKFMDKFLEIWLQHPSVRSEVLFNSTTSSMEMDAFVSGDNLFLESINATNSKIEEESGLLSDIRYIHSGLPRYTEGASFSQYFLPGAYDQSEPSQQWESQQPVGLQTVFQMFGAKDLTKERVHDLLTSTLSDLSVSPKSIPHAYSDLGEGVVVYSNWDGGRVSVLWDGRDSLAINLFTFKEDTEFAFDFANSFTSKESALQIALRDQMPRGHGRVVNFSRDLEEQKDFPPHWSIDNGRWIENGPHA